MPKNPSRNARKPSAKPITAREITVATGKIREASNARWSLGQRPPIEALPAAQFWDKEDIKIARRDYGRNFSQAEKILRELAVLNFQIESLRFLLEDATEKLGSALDREHALMEKIRLLRRK